MKRIWASLSDRTATRRSRGLSDVSKTGGLRNRWLSNLFARHTIVTWVRQAFAGGLLAHTALNTAEPTLRVLCWLVDTRLSGWANRTATTPRMPLRACSVRDMATYKQFTRFRILSACKAQCLHMQLRAVSNSWGHLDHVRTFAFGQRTPATRWTKSYRTAVYSAGHSLSS